MLEVVDLLEWSPNWHNLFFTQHLRHSNIVYSGFDCLFWLRCMPLIFVEHHPDKPQHKTTCFLPTAAQPLFVSESKPLKTCYNCHNVRYMRQIGRFVSFSFSSCNIAWNTNAWTLKPGPVRTQKQKQSEYVLQRLRKPLFLCNGNPLPTTLFFHCRPYLLAKCSLLAPPRFLLKPRSYWNFCLLLVVHSHSVHVSEVRRPQDSHVPQFSSSHASSHWWGSKSVAGVQAELDAWYSPGEGSAGGSSCSGTVGGTSWGGLGLGGSAGSGTGWVTFLGISLGSGTAVGGGLGGWSGRTSIGIGGGSLGLGWFTWSDSNIILLMRPFVGSWALIMPLCPASEGWTTSPCSARCFCFAFALAPSTEDSELAFMVSLKGRFRNMLKHILIICNYALFVGWV